MARTGPIPIWAGNYQRHRHNRGGKRQLNVALQRIAITQIRLGGAASAYIARRLTMGNTKTEAIRALRRQLSDEVYRRASPGLSQPSTSPVAVAT